MPVCSYLWSGVTTAKLNFSATWLRCTTNQNGCIWVEGVHHGISIYGLQSLIYYWILLCYTACVPWSTYSPQKCFHHHDEEYENKVKRGQAMKGIMKRWVWSITFILYFIGNHFSTSFAEYFLSIIPRPSVSQ